MEEKLWQTKTMYLKSRDITLLKKVCIVKAMVFPVVSYGCELDHKEGWMMNSDAFELWCWEKTLESPLDYKKMKPVNPKGNQPWTFIGRTEAEAEVPVLWPPNSKSTLTEKDPDAGKDWRQKEKGAAENEMVR